MRCQSRSPNDRVDRSVKSKEVDASFDSGGKTGDHLAMATHGTVGDILRPVLTVDVAVDPNDSVAEGSAAQRHLAGKGFITTSSNFTLKGADVPLSWLTDCSFNLRSREQAFEDIVAGLQHTAVRLLSCVSSAVKTRTPVVRAKLAGES